MDARIPLDETWRELLMAVADEHRLVREGVALTQAVSALSRVYNGLEDAKNTPGHHLLAARLGFSFARDVPKAAFAIRELIDARLIQTPLRMLDVGSGLGAMTFGVAAALANAQHEGKVHSTWIDTDADAMRVGLSIARRASHVGGVEVEVKTHHRASIKGDFDLIMLGQVLSEMDLELDEDARATRHQAVLQEWFNQLSIGGALVVVEPALRDRTRHLHRVRDRLARAGVAPFAPCLHAEACPALAAPTDWCHEDRSLDLPQWLAPLARAAGLRWQGLTYSYLVLRKDGASLRQAIGDQRGLVRVISRAIVSKGKRELVVCGQVLRGESLVSASARAAVLDRDHEGRESWDEAGRGDLLAIDPPANEGVCRLRLDRTSIKGVRCG